MRTPLDYFCSIMSGMLIGLLIGTLLYGTIMKPETDMTIKYDVAYTIERDGINDVRVYEFTPQYDENKTCMFLSSTKLFNTGQLNVQCYEK
ncbi:MULTISPECIES: hypothetical protein [Vibrio]|uniref:hypothetical protein n=1 Tax=Vibrio TaxID=662 RepID=UPI0020BECF69|nr:MULTISPECIES: hypothetical protein [unclassified Vibrio]MCK8112512.1 hypothetical protein [Vibrio sp. 2CM40D]MDW1754578.1 hypothetical protein [Vibrio sp. Vb2535]MDW2186915.1 hypothetical protein [Vibrio sp. 1733]MDW2236736.1 hypothetical protein [Vibrio sp. 1565-1]